MSEEFIDSLYARCPRCNSKLYSDEEGVPYCLKCYEELAKTEWDKYFEESVIPIIDLDCRMPILVKDWKKRISIMISGEKGDIKKND